MNQSFEEKIKTLKQIHARSSPDAINLVAQWEDRFARLQAQSEWLKHPNTMSLRNLVVEQIDLLVGILAEKEDMTELERARFFAQKQAHLIYLTVLTEDPDSQIKTIEAAVENELEPH